MTPALWPNLFAPQWAGPTPALEGIRDIETDLMVQFAINAGVTLTGANAIQLPIGTDGDLVVREIHATLGGGTSINPGAKITDLRIRVRDGEGNLITSDYIQVGDFTGAVGPGLYLRRGSVVFFEAQNIGASNIVNATIILKAVKRVLDPQVKASLPVPYTPMYDQYSKPPAGSHDEGYNYYYEFPLGSSSPASGAPVLVDPVNPTRTGHPIANNTGQFYGPFVSGGALYVVEHDNTGVQYGVSVYRSTDNGVTWQVQDDAHHPTGVQSTFGAFPAIALIGTVIHMGIRDSGNNAYIKTFDTSTNLWGASGASLAVGGSLSMALAVLSTGDRYLYWATSGVANSIKYAKFSGGVWGAITNIETEAGNVQARMMQVIADATDSMHVFYLHNDTVALTGGVAVHAFVSNLGVLGAITTIATIPNGTLQPGTAVLSPTLNGGTFAVCYNSDPGGVLGNQNIPQVVIGSPLVGTVWNVLSPDPAGSTVPVNTTALDSTLAVNSAGQIFATWLVADGVSGTTDKLFGAIYKGAGWTPPFLVYDAVANPNSAMDPPAVGNQANHLSTGQLPSGAYGVFFEYSITAGAAFPTFFVPFFPGGGGLQKFPLQTDNDAPFFVRGFAGDGRHAIAQITLFDPTGVPLQSRALGIETPITPYECIFSQDQGSHKVIFPEIEIPPGGVMQIDANLASALAFTTLKLELRGVKRFPGD